MLVILVVNHDSVIVLGEVTPTAMPLTNQRLSANHDLVLLQMEGGGETGWCRVSRSPPAVEETLVSREGINDFKLQPFKTRDETNQQVAQTEK